MNFIKILGIKIEVISRPDILAETEKALVGQTPKHFITLNPEIILHAQDDEEYFYILNHADLMIADGFGLKLTGWALGKNLSRLAGADFVTYLLKTAVAKKLTVGIVNRRDGLSPAAEIAVALKKFYPDLLFEVVDVDLTSDWKNFHSRYQFQPDILLVALGAPGQEKFIYHNYKKINNLKLAVGVGGTLDFLTGRVRRAPKILRLFGLEWLWRLKEQPSRWRRIYNATFVFVYKFLVYRYVYPFLYRPNVACLLYKKDVAGYKILLVERADSPGHWQLPQGGLDGLSIEAAGIKELSEEINCDKFKAMAVWPNLWQYNFDTKSDIPKRHQGFRGQKQSLFIAEFLGQDSDIRVNYWDHLGWQWVNSNDLASAVAAKRQPGASIYLEKFNNLMK